MHWATRGNANNLPNLGLVEPDCHRLSHERNVNLLDFEEFRREKGSSFDFVGISQSRRQLHFETRMGIRYFLAS
jgi:hypothetical protein